MKYLLILLCLFSGMGCQVARLAVMAPSSDQMETSDCACGYFNSALYTGAENKGIVAKGDLAFEVCATNHYFKTTALGSSHHEGESEIRWAKWTNQSKSYDMKLKLSAGDYQDTILLSRKRYPDQASPNSIAKTDPITVRPANFVWIGIRHSNKLRFTVNQGKNTTAVDLEEKQRRSYAFIMR